MRAVDIIAAKRDGRTLTDEEIRWFIRGVVAEEIPDYQTSALLMAIYLRGMDDRETATLTRVMVESGDELDLSALGDHVVDKHSSGGVGDKTTLVVGPMVAARGLPVAKMSGRGLGFTGGTLDKLESIPGFQIDLDHERFMRQVREVGLVVAGTTASLAPADGTLYALRDVTATVSSLPLIASSIMSKKLAAGADAIVLDVKVGAGAFMKTLDDARALAEKMVAIGERMGRDVVALLSDMDQPLGRAVGNALEVEEAIATLRGDGPSDFEQHCVTVAAHMLRLGRRVETVEDGETLAREALTDGSALERFRAMVEAQGGDVAVIDDPSLLPQAPVVEPLAAERDATLARIDALEVGLTVVELGGGREKKGDPVDHTVGVMLAARAGDRIEKGAPVLRVHARTSEEAASALVRLRGALEWTDGEVEPPPLFYDVID